MSSNSPLNINTPTTIAEDLYNAFSIRRQSLSHNRPVWNINVSVDVVSFYVGAIGSVGMGYILNQYEPRNIDNISYVNEQGLENSNFIMKVVRHTFLYPLSIAQRFFLGGALYCSIGFATHKFIGRARPFACGALTGLYFAYDAPFTMMLQAVGGFSVFAVLMEYLAKLSLG